jgi:hypothetical protein
MGLMENYEKYQKTMFDILKRKNADYSGKEDTYANFQYCEKLGLCSTEAGIMVRISDKMTRISNLLKQDAKVKEETIKDTLLDMANYAMILASYIEDKNKNLK